MKNTLLRIFGASAACVVCCRRYAALGLLHGPRLTLGANSDLAGARLGNLTDAKIPSYATAV